MGKVFIDFFAVLYVTIGILGGLTAVGFLLCLALIVWSEVSKKFRDINQK